MKFQLLTPDSIQLRESRGFVKDIHDPASSIREPLSEYSTMLDLIHRDPTLATAYEIVSEFASYRGYDFIRGTKKQRDKLRQLFEDLNFMEVLPNLLHSMLYYGDAFLELRKKNSKVPNELWVLETTEMRIRYDAHGVVEGYVQRPFQLAGLSEEEVLQKEGTPEKPNQGIFFSADEVIHFRMKWIGSQVYSYNPNEPLSTVASTRLYAGNYLMNIFINMPPRYVAHLAGISQTDFEKAKREFQSAKTNYKRTIAFSRSTDPKSQLQLQKVDAPYDKDLLEVIKWLNKEIVKRTRVPSTWLEGAENENRGVGESLHLPFEVHVQSIHRSIIEPPINRVLMKQLGYYKKAKEGEDYVLFRFNEISKKGENEVLMNAGLLRDMGLKPEALVRYLDERGILGLDEEDFEEQQLAKNMELNSSRQRMNPRMQNMTQNRNSAGVSEAGGAKIKEQHSTVKDG